MKTLQISHDANGQPTYALTFSDFINVKVLGAGVAETVTKPTGARFVSFSATGNFYCSGYSEATVPSTDIEDGTGSELNPVIRDLRGITYISLIAPSDCTVTMSFYG